MPGSSHANYGAGSSLRKLEGRLIERPSSPHGTELHANDRGGQWLGNQQRHRLLRLRVHGALSAVRVHGARDGGRRSLEGRRRVLGAVLSRGSCSWKQDSSTKRGRLEVVANYDRKMLQIKRGNSHTLHGNPEYAPQRRRDRPPVPSPPYSTLPKLPVRGGGGRVRFSGARALAKRKAVGLKYH